ncbi:hypothetical protein KSP40_PGU019121 [Platanthera guangdongensis]|uniref:Uncharacterized protein n=1 Tax=Platanthera guangdongensis TaxID=2320717 RepID=A0ABR2MES0_9ASPA
MPEKTMLLELAVGRQRRPEEDAQQMLLMFAEEGDQKKDIDPRNAEVKEEVVEMQGIQQTIDDVDCDYMYMKGKSFTVTYCPVVYSRTYFPQGNLVQALYHTLPMKYVTVGKLQHKLDGETNQNTTRKLLDRMIHDGYIKNSGKKRLGK